jgi:Tol biopolymer transport system component
MRARPNARLLLPAIGVLALAFFALAPGAFGQTQAEDLYQQALRVERVSGDLEEAIRLYQQVVETGDRPLGARALIRMAESYEKLGRQGALDAYSRIIQEFGDQEEQVALARERLAALQASEPTPQGEVPATQTRRLVMSDVGCYVEGIRPSPDGTRLAYSDLCASGDVYVRDLASGEVRQVTTEGFYIGAVWSPDGTRLAVEDSNAGWANRPHPFRIVDLTTGAMETPSVLENTWFSPHDWSPDGEWLSGVRPNDGNTRSSVVVSLRTGEFITLASPVNAAVGRSTFSPDGRFVAFSDHVDGNQDLFVMELTTQERVRITSDPGPDSDALWSPDGNTLAYHGEGGYWAIRMENGRPEGEPQHIPGGGGWEASWVGNGYFYSTSSSFRRTYRIPVDPETARPTGSPEIFPEVGHGRFAWSPDGQKIAAASWYDPRNAIFVTDGGSETAYPVGDEILTTKLWWSPDGNEILFTSRDRLQRDKRKTVYSLDISTGSMRELFPRLDSIGHIHLSPDGERMVFQHGGVASKGQEIRVSELGSPEGLVLARGDHPEGELSGWFGQPLFSPDGSLVAFTRQDQSKKYGSSLWVVPADGSAPPRLLARAPLIPDLIWHPNGRFIAFYGRDSNEQTARAISVASLETGEVDDLLDFSDTEDGIRLNHWSPDGRWIGFSRSQRTHDYWVVDDPLAGGGGRP